MDVTIKDLYEPVLDNFINQDTDRFGRITRKATDKDHTVDLLINVSAITVGDHFISIKYPNDNIAFIPCKSDNYLKIEVM